MSMEISYPNIGLISPNYDVINKANKILAGKTTEIQTGMTHSPIAKLLVKKYQNKTPP